MNVLKFEEIEFYLQQKKYTKVDNYYNIFIPIGDCVNLNITFQLVTPTKGFTSLFNIKHCTCITSCCGKKDNNLLFTVKDFEKFEKSLIDEYKEKYKQEKNK